MAKTREVGWKENRREVLTAGWGNQKTRLWQPLAIKSIRGQSTNPFPQLLYTHEGGKEKQAKTLAIWGRFVLHVFSFQPIHPSCVLHALVYPTTALRQEDNCGDSSFSSDVFICSGRGATTNWRVEYGRGWNVLGQGRIRHLSMKKIAQKKRAK